MTLVDTTVWIDFFAGRKTKQIEHFEKLIEDGEDVAICGVIITEILQGIREDKVFIKTHSVLDDLIYVSTTKETHLLAAQIYRGSRKRGLTIRKPIDCIIAATCIENSMFILHNDRDFDNICKHFPLQCA
jgi:predicted nucleic acid-binding protein